MSVKVVQVQPTLLWSHEALEDGRPNVCCLCAAELAPQLVKQNGEWRSGGCPIALHQKDCGARFHQECLAKLEAAAAKGQDVWKCGQCKRALDKGELHYFDMSTYAPR